MFHVVISLVRSTNLAISLYFRLKSSIFFKGDVLLLSGSNKHLRSASCSSQCWTNHLWGVHSWFTVSYLETATDISFTTMSTTGRNGTALRPYTFCRSMSFGTAASNFSATF